MKYIKYGGAIDHISNFRDFIQVLETLWYMKWEEANNVTNAFFQAWAHGWPGLRSLTLEADLFEMDLFTFCKKLTEDIPEITIERHDSFCKLKLRGKTLLAITNEYADLTTFMCLDSMWYMFAIDNLFLQ